MCLVFTIFVGSQKSILCLRFIFFAPCVHKSFGPLGSYNFWGLSFIKDMSSLGVVFVKLVVSSNSPEVLFSLVSCVYNILGVSGS